MIYTLDKINEAAKYFIENIGEDRVFAFNGHMGAGKTTLISAICDELQVVDTVNSPTFAIVNEYEVKNTKFGDTIYHFDCYRLEKIQDALNLGAEEYLYSGNLCFIEWAENIEQILPIETVNVNIKVIDEVTRELTIEK